MLVGLNDNGASSRTVTVQTGFGANVQLHDYTGHAADISTNGSGQATIIIPKDVNGAGYGLLLARRAERRFHGDGLRRHAGIRGCVRFGHQAPPTAR